MGQGTITKVMKYQIIYEKGAGSFEEMQSRFWSLQRDTRKILNKTIQICSLWDYRKIETLDAGEKLDIKQETKYNRLDSYVYNCLKDCSDLMAPSLINAAIQKAFKKFNSSIKDIHKGDISLPSYKKDQPIIIPKKEFVVNKDGMDFFVRINAFSKQYKTKNELDKKVSFKIVVGDSTQKTILERVLNGEYSISESQIFYEKKKWFFFLAYSFIPQEIKLDYEKILGVDLGVHYAICAASNYQQGCLKIYGDEVISFAKKEEARKWALQKQAVISGDGRIGHGTKTRVSYAYKSENKISNFRDTINHRYSKALIDFAVKNGFGTIQMEDLSGIKESRNNSKRLSHWTYFDLQTKIEYKAKEKGIAVVKINPAFMLMYGKEASNRKQEIDRQHYTIPNQRPKDKHCGKI